MRLHWLVASGYCSWHTLDHGSPSTSTAVPVWSPCSLLQHRHLVCGCKYWLNQTTFWLITRQKKPKPVTQPISGATQTSNLKLWPTHPCQALLGTDASASDRNPSVECKTKEAHAYLHCVCFVPVTVNTGSDVGDNNVPQSCSFNKVSFSSSWLANWTVVFVYE